MFEADVRSSKDKTRNGLDGTGKTVYSEVKLSAKLLQELKTCKTELEIVGKREREARAAKVTAEIDLKQAQMSVIEADNKIQVLLHTLSQSDRLNQDLRLSCSYFQGQFQALQAAYAVEEDKAKHYAVLLQEERAKNDKLRNHTTELEYSNELLKMQSDVMGERLKGLYQSIETLTGSQSVQVVTTHQAIDMSLSATHLLRDFHFCLESLSTITTERDNLRSENAELASFRLEAFSNKQRLARMMRDKLVFMQQSLKLVEDERDRLKLQVQQQDKHIFDLSEQFAKLRERLKQMKQRRKAHGEEEERICRKCLRVYEDSENYNWSCRTHQSDFSGEIWWCCGKPGRDAPGCRVEKHESKEEDEGDSADKKEQEALRLAMKRCPSCKGYGHLPQECPKDPNFRSQCDLIEEMARLGKLVGIKHKHALPSPEMSAFALHVLGMRSQQNQFNDPRVASSPDSSLLDEEEFSQTQPVPFQDVFSLKMRVKKQNTSFEVAQFETKALRNEGKLTKLAQIRRLGALQLRPASNSPPTSRRELFGSM